MFCFNCGYDCGTNSFKFCPSCGTKLEIPSAPVSTPEPTKVPEPKTQANTSGFSAVSPPKPTLPREVYPTKGNLFANFSVLKRCFSSFNTYTQCVDVCLGQKSDARPVESVDPYASLTFCYQIARKDTGKIVPGLEQITTYFATQLGLYFTKKDGGLFFMDGETGMINPLSSAVKNAVSMAYNSKEDSLTVTWVSEIGRPSLDYREPRGSQDYTDNYEDYVYAVYPCTTKSLKLDRVYG